MASSNKNYYQILGVSPSVTQAQVKKAYRDLVKTRHPDLKHKTKNDHENKKANEDMRRLNEAYAVLSDKTKRAEYDVIIGISKGIRISFPKVSSLDEDTERQKYLRSVFSPTRLSIAKLLSKYKKQIAELSLDPFDDELLGNFVEYIDSLEACLYKGSQELANTRVPRTLEAAVHMLKHSIAQAADGMEELRYFCQNFDYGHLTMASNLFHISQDLSRESFKLTKS